MMSIFSMALKYENQGIRLRVYVKCVKSKNVLKQVTNVLLRKPSKNGENLF